MNSIESSEVESYYSPILIDHVPASSTGAIGAVHIQRLISLSHGYSLQSIVLSMDGDVATVPARARLPRAMGLTRRSTIVA